MIRNKMADISSEEVSPFVIMLCRFQIYTALLR